MRVALLTAVSTAAFLTSSCGGESGSTPSTNAPAPPPTLAVTLSKSSTDVTVAEGETASFGFMATYTGSSSDPVVPDVAINGKRYALDGTPTASGQKFDVALKTSDFAPGGKSTSTVTFRLCKSSACATVYPGSTQTFTVNLDVQLKDWAMFQRNSGHTGYVAARYDAQKIAQAWTWKVAPGLDARPVSADVDSVYVVEGKDDIPATADVADRVVRLDASNGQPVWDNELKIHNSISGASLNGGMLYINGIDLSTNTNPIYFINKSDGSIKYKNQFSSQYGEYMQPTIHAGKMYVAAGFYGDQVFGYDALTGSKLWESYGSFGITDGESVAVDSDSVYYYAGRGVDLFDPTTGVLKRTLENQYFTGGEYGWESALMLDGSGGIYGMNGTRAWPYSANAIIGYSTLSTQAVWKTAKQYIAHPALSNGFIYALRSDSRAIDAINTKDGSVAWSIPIPGSGNLRNNVVVTENLLFVSTETDTYAFDLKSSERKMVWSAPVSGMLAITPNNLLIVAGIDSVTAFQLS
ncbi:PQQ-binding-like beta-propeller repeat protein [Porphyrobacter algicida]|uniref:PQQ-binding-like beta-propeller repeat protein n=1 Tax=Qipengyuania algicida TaxID=1836209 RepID=A0A845AAX6_9SPHN|nr:PQQ-binding-like beta-propeller repeat protein [Qipengyuania algicida]MXP27390.1 PQQ-binding-like beta-propeller repeat protein [Qipengyuania algicida]